MFTTYDEIWEAFLNNCKTDDINLPQTNERRYSTIRNAVLFFNNRTRERLLCVDETETLSERLSDDYLLILANYLRLIFLKNQLTEFEGIWQPFQQDVGLRNFSSQLNSLRASVKEQEDTIDELFMYAEVDYL